MIKKYVFQDVEYSSELDVRKALFDKSHKMLGKTPSENVPEFWAKFGVVYIEEQEPIEFFKTQKSFAIKRAFLDWRNNKATLISSLGFKADSNERANTDVSGLLVAYEDNQDALITFRDAENQFHELSYSQLKVLRLEIIANGNYAYEQKWLLDAQVESATTKEELDTIDVEFVGKNFIKE